MPSDPLHYPPVETKSITTEILLGQGRIFNLIAGGNHLDLVLEEFAEMVDAALGGDARCCVMLLQAADHTLRVGAAPRLAPSFRSLLDGMSVGLAPGSCSAAAHRNETVISSDVATDPIWEGLRDEAAEEGTGACWSVPIRSVQFADAADEEDEVRVLGTVAFYHSAARGPVAQELEALDMASALAALILITARAHERAGGGDRYDTLTGLPNRKLFSEQLKQALTDLSPREHKLAVLLLDIDHFREVNETFGYAVGDFLLRSVAQRLTKERRAADLLARFGDDEFIFMMPAPSGGDDFRKIAAEILTAVNEPHDFSGQPLAVTASLGASLYPWDGEDAQTLMRNAENALREAKRQGRNRYRLYAPTMGANAFEKLQLKMALAYAAENNELELLFQPKVRSRSRQIVGAEALVYWNHPSQGRISPGKFIPLAEETGLILPIGEWVLRRACEQARRWRESGFSDLTVAVNISAHQFRERTFGDTVASILDRAGLAPQAVELEITETVAMTDVKKTMERLNELQALGLQISIDDFGTGYSSLAYLKKFPIHTLKIDQSFVRELPDNKENKAITKAVIALAHFMGLELVAEGVETAEQVEFLSEEGCHYLQGYYFARPVPSREFSELLSEGSGEPPGKAYLNLEQPVPS